jgi:hypothetical protein
VANNDAQVVDLFADCAEYARGVGKLGQPLFVIGGLVGRYRGSSESALATVTSGCGWQSTVEIAEERRTGRSTPTTAGGKATRRQKAATYSKATPWRSMKKCSSERCGIPSASCGTLPVRFLGAMGSEAP